MERQNRTAEKPTGTENSKRGIRITNAMIATGCTLFIAGMISLGQLDKGPLSPVESSIVALGGLILWHAGETIKSEIVKRAKN